MELAVRSVDHLLSGRELAAGETHEIAPNLLFRPQGRIRFMPDARNVFGKGGLNDKARAFLAAPHPPDPDLPTGVFELRDVVLAPPVGLILDLNNRTCWTGSMLGWSERELRKFEKPLGLTIVDGTVLLDAAAASRMTELDAAVLNLAPHYDNYGHWILEFLTRIDMAVAFGHGDLPFFCQSGQSWSEVMAHTIAPVKFLSPRSVSSGFVRVRRLIVPSIARILNSGDDAALRATWMKLSEGLAKSASDSARPRSRKIAISRRDWTNSINLRRLVNADRIEGLLEKNGFEVVAPHKLPLAEQRDIFHHADVVVGEDGSAMHNTIFCRPGTRIGLTSMDRINYLHLLTAKVFDHRVTFIETEPVENHAASKLLRLRRLSRRELNFALSELLQ